ncbi:MAG: serine/threonine-protein kinase [Myxococcota bacterium]
MLERGLQRFGPFMIVRPLGRGGMGEVFVARTPWDPYRVAAVKRLRPDVARVPTFAERFRHEALLAVRLEHPNVVGTIDVGSVDGQLYVASDLVVGKDTAAVADRLRERGQGAPVAVVIRILLDVLSGLAYVHGAREPDGRWLALVHRDVTPGNVLVSYEGTARLADFGLARSQLSEGSNLTNHGEILGTPHYLAPEVIRGAKATPASDIYGLGAVTYRVLTGVAPFQGTTAEVLFKALSERPRPLSDWRPDLPSWFVEFVHEMLESDVKRRPFDAGLLVRRLEHEAQQAKLLLPAASVGRWLSALFEEEKVEDLAEYERIAALDPLGAASAAEGTVVLARPSELDKLRAPNAMPSGRELDDAGTELDLSENDLDGVRRARAVRARPDSETAGIAPTAIAKKAHRAEDDFEALPTWATQQPAPSDAAPSDRTPRVEEPPGDGHLDRTADDPDDRTEENQGRGLPGFVDQSLSHPDPPMVTDRAPLVKDEPRLAVERVPRPKAPDSVVVQPARDREGPLVRVSPTIPERVERPVERPPETDSSKVAALRREARPEPRPVAPSREITRRLFRGAPPQTGILVAIAGGLVAVAAGVLIGVWLGERRPALNIEEKRTVLLRFEALRAKVSERSAKHVPVDPIAIQGLTDAAAAIVAEEYARASISIDGAEQALATSITAIPPRTTTSTTPDG